MLGKTALLLGASWMAVAADPAVTDLYLGGSGGYHSYRIPALLATRKGTLLAFCEARKNSARDDGDIDLVVRRSRDMGRTWSATALVHEEGGDAAITIGNPSPVQDRRTGVIHLLFARNNQRVFEKHSSDEGETWSDAVELTERLRAFDFAWTRVGIGPGHAIQLRSGRLLVPVWLNDRIKGNYRSAAIYSDDGGATWKTGGIVPQGVATNANECMFYERRDGAVVVSLRSSVHQRHTAISRDGGVKWSDPKPVAGVPDPVCQASILAMAKGRVVFANPGSEQRRINMTLRLSLDDGATWPVAKPLFDGPSGYSDLAAGKDGTLFCLFEYGAKGAAEKIGFAAIPRGWLRP